MTAFTLADYSVSPKPLLAGIAKVLREESPFMDSVSFEDAGSLAIKVLRQGSLPAISWRRIGADHGSAKAGKPDLVEEQAYSFGNYVDVDKALIRDGSAKLYDPRAYNTEQVVTAMARTFNDKAINGLPTEEDNPVGLWYRVVNDLTGQNLDAASGSGLDISADATGLAANIQTFLDQLDKLIYSTAGHGADLLLMNSTMLQRYWSIARQSGLLKTTSDNLGREFYEYKGAKIIDMGYKYDDSTKIIGDVELTNGSALTGGSATSIYAVKLGKEYFTPWQEYALEADTIKLEDGVTERTVIDWVVGIALSHPRSIARLYGIIAA